MVVRMYWKIFHELLLKLMDYLLLRTNHAITYTYLVHVYKFSLGDVILSVNGDRVGEVTHRQLVHKIRRAGDTLR